MLLRPTICGWRSALAFSAFFSICNPNFQKGVARLFKTTVDYKSNVAIQRAAALGRSCLGINVHAIVCTKGRRRFAPYSECKESTLVGCPHSRGWMLVGLQFVFASHSRNRATSLTPALDMVLSAMNRHDTTMTSMCSCTGLGPWAIRPLHHA